MPNHIKYYGIWDLINNAWIYTKSPHLKEEMAYVGWLVRPDKFIVNNSIGVWLDREKLESDRLDLGISNRYSKIREFTGLDAMKERIKNNA